MTAQFADGEVTVDGADRIDASVGDVIAVNVTSDVDEEIHLHGYNVFVDLTPGEPAALVFTADTPGKFEVEFEQSGAFIAEIVVS